ncbi:hypothetical protein I553_4018 [Mycobacterium xenopi 4042]|uniref:Uncharacterized protein n=1 Tax=Mycobacterium xenopi 4042 TaxID=1299334 RepID=X8BDY6_MYCXE|nr:hypothetical protein I553_4018 [Mycobacterium xenopi 4042]
MALTHEGERVHDYLATKPTTSSSPRFDAGLLTVVAVVASVLVWNGGHRGRRWWSRCRSAWWRRSGRTPLARCWCVRATASSTSPQRR